MAVGGLRLDQGLTPDLFDRGAPCRLPLLLLIVSWLVPVVDCPCSAASFRATGHGRRSLGEADTAGCRRVACGLPNST
jgi:hypothetical protein